MAFLHAAGITQAILLGLFFFHRKRAPGNRLEAILLWLLALAIWIGQLYSTGAILEFPHIARTGFSLMALLGPLFYFSIRLREGVPIRARDFLWFVVPAGITLYLIPFHLSSREHKLAYLREDLVRVHLDCLVILYVTLANNLGSMITALFRVFQKNRGWIRETGERSLAIGHTLYYLLLTLILVISGIVVSLDSTILNSGFCSGAATVVILIRSYSQFYIQNQFPRESFSVSKGALSETESEARAESYPPAVRYKKSLLPEEEVSRIGKKIEAFLEEEKPYLEPDFQLSDLLPVSELTLVQTSQVINRHFRGSFTDVTRKYRVQEACELLRTRPDTFTILDIAMESGFNSKSSFNMVFRQITGQLPSDYRREIREKQN